MERVINLALVCLFLASCRHPMPTSTPVPRSGAVQQTDAFAIHCAAPADCQKSFTTTLAPLSEVTVLRNGLTLYGGPQNFDYTAAPQASGTVTVTMSAQPTADGDLILLRYLTSAAERK